jgi:transcriptional regulator with GAF, ATPase, and Fis domain
MSSNQPPKPLTDFEIVSVRQNINLIKTQLKAGSIDSAFLARQIESLTDFLERVDAEQKQRKAARRFEALYNVSRVLGTSLDLQTVLDQVMDAVIQITGAERGFLMLRDDDGGLRTKAAATSINKPWAAKSLSTAARWRITCWTPANRS